MTDYQIIGVRAVTTDGYGRKVPDRIVANIRVGKAARLAQCELTRTEAYRLADQILTALWRTGEPK